MRDKDIYKNIIRQAKSGMLGKHIDEHYLIWAYAYHREGRNNPMNGFRYKRPNVIYL